MTTPSTHREVPNDIRNDPVISRLLDRMPRKVAESFDEEQLSHIRNAIGAREWGKHKIDLRGTMKFFRWRYYYVVLAGRNRRALSESEKKFATLLTATLLSAFILVSILFGLLVLYLVKSALGINLIDDYSFGIWDWFKTQFL